MDNTSPNPAPEATPASAEQVAPVAQPAPAASPASAVAPEQASDLDSLLNSLMTGASDAISASMDAVLEPKTKRDELPPTRVDLLTELPPKTAAAPKQETPASTPETEPVEQEAAVDWVPQIPQMPAEVAQALQFQQELMHQPQAPMQPTQAMQEAPPQSSSDEIAALIREYQLPIPAALLAELRSEDPGVAAQALQGLLALQAAVTHKKLEEQWREQFSQLETNLPARIQQEQQIINQTSRVVDNFYAQHPDLNNPAGRAEVVRLAERMQLTVDKLSVPQVGKYLADLTRYSLAVQLRQMYPSLGKTAPAVPQQNTAAPTKPAPFATGGAQTRIANPKPPGDLIDLGDLGKHRISDILK